MDIYLYSIEQWVFKIVLVVRFRKLQILTCINMNFKSCDLINILPSTFYNLPGSCFSETFEVGGIEAGIKSQRESLTGLQKLLQL